METVQDVMTKDPIMLPKTTSVAEAARMMRDHAIGDVLVVDGRENAYGILTDRDVTVRAVAEGLDPQSAQVGEICTRALVTLAAADPIDTAVQVMRDQALRRIPVLEAGHPLGIVSLGDLARDRDPSSVLADISAAPPST